MTDGNDSAYPQLEQLEEERFNDEFGRYESFPITEVKGGLTKREEFASRNMAAMNANPMFKAEEDTPQKRARLAIIEADALIEALNKS